MKKSTKVIISGVVIAVIGVIIIIVSLASAGWKFKDNYEMNTYAESGQNTALEIDWNAGNIKTEFYDGEKIEITYPSSKMYKVEITEKANKLSIRSKSRAILWIGPINVPETVIKLPKSTVYSLDVDLSAGNVYLADGDYSNLNIDISAGSLKCGKFSCKRFETDLSAGDVKIDGVNADYINCDISAGSAKILNAVCPEIYIDISAGSLNIKIDGEKSLYNISASVSAGKCNVNNQTGSSSGHRLDIHVSAGNIDVDFTK